MQYYNITFILHNDLGQVFNTNRNTAGKTYKCDHMITRLYTLTIFAETSSKL